MFNNKQLLNEAFVGYEEFCRSRPNIQNISPFLKEFRHFALCFSTRQNNTTLSPGFFGQRFNNLQRVALLTSLIQYGEDSYQIWWTAAGLLWIMRVVLTNQNRENILNE